MFLHFRYLFLLLVFFEIEHRYVRRLNRSSVTGGRRCLSSRRHVVETFLKIKNRTMLKFNSFSFQK
jgi:hypothetical protein